MNLSKYLKRLFGGKPRIFNYRGTLLELRPDCWILQGKRFENLDQVDKEIDKNLNELNNSIINKK